MMNIEINKFVIVKYEGELFPGRVTAMAKRAGGWFWPKIPDEIDYKRINIFKKLTILLYSAEEHLEYKNWKMFGALICSNSGYLSKSSNFCTYI